MFVALITDLKSALRYH